MRQGRTAKKLERLASVLEGKKTLLIVLQDNPDPDAMAAGAALRELVRQKQGITCSFAHGGVVGRAENRALAKYVGFNYRPLNEIDPHAFDLVATVDTQPGTGNNSLPLDAPVDIVIDHHPARAASRKARFSDIRRNYGATSTILFEYLKEAKVEISVPLATALLYGIRSDTQDLGREAGRPDIEAHCFLYPLSNPRILGQITHSELPREYYQLLYRGLQAARRYGRGVAAALGQVENPDMIGEVADLLLRHEGVGWSLVWGRRGDTLLASLRAASADADAGRGIHRIIGRYGSAGGHDQMAGGQISLAEAKSAAAVKRIEATLLKRFLRLIGEKDTRAERLVAGAEGT